MAKGKRAVDGIPSESRASSTDRQRLRNAEGQKVLLVGHRRITGSHKLAERHQPGFTHDMEVEAIELMGATIQDLLVESVSDNCNRKDMSPTHRLRAVKRFHEAAVEVKRAARALGVSDQTYKRDLRIVRQDWMLRHVEAERIAPTVAARILEKAEENGRLKEVEEDFEAWISVKMKERDETKRKHKAATGKELKDSELLVKDKHLIDRWIECIESGRRFDNEAEWEFNLSLDENGTLTVPALTLDLTKASAEQMAKIVSRMSQAVKQLIPYAREREQVERLREEVKGEKVPYDFDILRQLGMEEKAKRLEEKYRAKLAGVKEGEEDPDHGRVEQRTEQDLAGTIELPEQGPLPGTPPAPSVPPPAKEPEETEIKPQAQPTKAKKNTGKEAK